MGVIAQHTNRILDLEKQVSKHCDDLERMRKAINQQNVVLENFQLPWYKRLFRRTPTLMLISLNLSKPRPTVVVGGNK